MNATTRLLAAGDPARDLPTTLDERAEAELVALVGPGAAASSPPPRTTPTPPPRRRRILVEGFGAAALLAAVVAVLVVVPGPRPPVGTSTPAPTAAAPPTSPAPALGLVRRVWRVESAAGEGGGTWLRFGATDLRLIRTTGSTELGWRAQGPQLLVVPGTARTAPAWLTAATTFRPDGAGYDLVDVTGRTTARLEPAAGAPVGPARIDAAVRAALADARPGPAASVDPAALVGSWRLNGVPATTAWLTFHGDGTWVTGDRCPAAEGPETDFGGYRLLASGVLLSAADAGQPEACANDRTDGATISTLGVLLRGRSLRIDGDTATVFDAGGAVLARLVRF